MRITRFSPCLLSSCIFSTAFLPRLSPAAAWMVASGLSMLSTMARAEDVVEDTASSAVRREILALDARISDAYNHCRIQPLKALFASNAELYFADRGVTRQLFTYTDTLRRTFCGKYRREAPASDQRIYSLPDYGAIQIGTQSFCAVDSQPCRGQRMQFMAIWRQRDGEWRITRLMHYAYTPAG
ncbi:MAG: nuclear transport factor 2 family protein [Lysobacteraceae bacterium]